MIALPGRSSTVADRPGWRRHSCAAYQPWPPPMSSSERAGGQPQLAGHLGGAQPGEVELTGDVAPPVRIVGRGVVMPVRRRKDDHSPRASGAACSLFRSFGPALDGGIPQRLDLGVLVEPGDTVLTAHPAVLVAAERCVSAVRGAAIDADETGPQAPRHG